MNGKYLKSTFLLAVCMTLAALLVLTTATFAWFTANSRVSASRVETSTAYEDLTLYVKAPSDSAFTGNTCRLEQIAGSTTLRPVSTDDLLSFVYCPQTVSDNAESFARVSDIRDQNLFFLGAVDLRAETAGEGAGGRVAVYLEESEALGALVQKTDEESLLLNAARLGLMLRDHPETARIFYLSDTENDEDDQIRNTVIDGELQPDGIVLHSTSAGRVTAADDPALPLGGFMLPEEGDPGQPLFDLEPYTDYTLDVFFYLEGCDPDCSEAVEYDAADLGLAFYATLAPED